MKIDNVLIRSLFILDVSIDLAKPRIHSAPVSRNVLAGSLVSLNCNGSGIPSPNITWLINGNPILGANQPTIRFVNVDLGKTGNYQCLFQNNAGSTISAIGTLFVYSKHQIK